MASAFGHAALAYASSSFLPKEFQTRAIIITGMISSALPDADVIAFMFGIPYEHMLGHRGITHSLFFALFWSYLLTLYFDRKPIFSINVKVALYVFFFFCTASHGLLDACTTGGRGVAFLAPFSRERYFFPWRVIRVSPLGIDRFFTHRGVEIIKNEAFYIGLPSLFLFLAGKVYHGSTKSPG